MSDTVTDLLFVYGTLMRGYDHPMAKLLSRHADFVSDAQCRGRLYLVRHYPGLILSNDPVDVVHGELFRIRRTDELLVELDRYEACGDDFEAPTEYVREIVQVTHAGGATVEAWTYLYNWPLTTLPRIASGRFFCFGLIGPPDRN